MGDVDIRYLAGSYVNAFNADGSTSTQHEFSLKQKDFFEQDGHSIINVHAILFDTIQTCRLLQGMNQLKTNRVELIMDLCSLTDDDKFSIMRLRQHFEVLIFGDKTTLILEPLTEWGLISCI